MYAAKPSNFGGFLFFFFYHCLFFYKKGFAIPLYISVTVEVEV